VEQPYPAATRALDEAVDAAVREPITGVPWQRIEKRAEPKAEFAIRTNEFYLAIEESPTESIPKRKWLYLSLSFGVSPECELDQAVADYPDLILPELEAIVAEIKRTLGR
jgi:hypothetical protein